ncbi:DUF1559 family PulG-like putative transporter [Gimesia panareensis]|uniref:DUF1559 family PulG-like putative transporter n=1 Tax=Gimesia panareensis TaxID=2527978 RepID=UPI00118BA4E3|nr:DUF1559 domain-containing protein [Gimesia panareensis]QDU48499.1 hypothetical protein Pan110_08140 [Gimesia panareensis]
MMILMSRTEFGVVIGVMLLLIALVLPALQHSREEARQATSKHNLKLIGLALYCYEDYFTALPYGGTIREEGVAMHGWMMSLLRFQGDNTFSNWIDYNKPWDRPENFRVSELRIPDYLVPGVDADYTTTGFGLTHYLGNPNLLHRNRRVTFDQLNQGTSYNWLAGEVVDHYQPWSYPFNWRPLGSKLCDGPHSFGRPVWGGGHLLRADGSVTFFSDQTAPEILKAFDKAPPIATREQTAVPDRTFQFGDFDWGGFDLPLDPQGDNRYIVEVFWDSSQRPLQINLYITKYFTPEERAAHPRSSYRPLRFLAHIGPQTDIAAALKATTLADETTPAQFQANVKLLQKIQQELPAEHEGSEL